MPRRHLAFIFIEQQVRDAFVNRELPASLRAHKVTLFQGHLQEGMVKCLQELLAVQVLC